MMDQVVKWVVDWFVGYAQGNPNFAFIFIMMAFSRALFKPVMTVIETYVKTSPSQKDDEWLSSLKASKGYQSLVWLIDYLSSIKLPK